MIISVSRRTVLCVVSWVMFGLEVCLQLMGRWCSFFFHCEGTCT